MNSQKRNARRRISPNPKMMAASALLAAAGLAAPASADIWTWIAGNGLWSNAANWSPGSVPGLAWPFGQTIHIGNMPAAANATVLLDHPVGFGAMTYNDMHLSGGVTLDSNGRQLGTLAGNTTLTGANTRLILRSSAGPNFHDMTSGTLALNPGTLLSMQSDARLRVGWLNNTGVVSGQGTIYTQAGPMPSLWNNGTIAGSNNGGLTFIQEGIGRFDLDGAPAESVEFGQLNMSSPYSQLTFQGDQLTDAFSGTVFMGAGSLLSMNMSNGWTADLFSTFNVASAVPNAAAQIAGGHFTFGGHLNVGGSAGHLRVLADATLQSTANVFVGDDDVVEFDGATTVQGGQYTFQGGLGVVRFDGPTTVQGGAFNMAGNEIIHGRVEFNGATTWDGVVNINGFGRQTGNATVTGPTVINAGVFGMDGYYNDAVWQVNNSLVVNADRIGAVAHNNFSGTMNIAGGALSRLTINLTNPNETWVMNGTMNLAGAGTLPVTRVAGSRMILRGGLNATSGTVEITADTDAWSGSAITITPNTTLRMRGTTTVQAGTNFAGAGTFRNGLGGTMVLSNGVALNQVGLTNQGRLIVGADTEGAATVIADRFTQLAAGTLEVAVLGYDAAIRNDLLMITSGAAVLDGMLDVAVLRATPGAMLPKIGDEFTIIRALGGVSGAFVNDPVSQVGGLTYDWTVVYNTNTVVLRLENIVPAPGSVALLGLGLLIAARRRRA